MLVNPFISLARGFQVIHQLFHFNMRALTYLHTIIQAQLHVGHMPHTNLVSCLPHFKSIRRSHGIRATVIEIGIYLDPTGVSKNFLYNTLLPVKAFMKVERDLLSILKNGSLTGQLCEPHRAVCSRMWETPVLSIGVVLNATLQRRGILSSDVSPVHNGKS